MNLLEGILLAYLVAMGAWCALDAWHSLRCPYCRAARKFLRARKPQWRIWTDFSSHRATEPDRAVVAVFYERPHIDIHPPPYKLFAVARDTFTVERLPKPRNSSPYAILGRK